MSVESDLVARIIGNADVAGLIGTRLYPLRIPDDAALPAIAYQEIDGIGERTLGGHFVYTARRYQLRLVADSYEMIVKMKTAVGGVDDGPGPTGAYTRLFIDEGPDGFEFETQRYEKVLEAQVNV